MKSFTHRLDYKEGKLAKYGDKTEELDHLAKVNVFFFQSINEIRKNSETSWKGKT